MFAAPGAHVHEGVQTSLVAGVARFWLGAHSGRAAALLRHGPRLDIALAAGAAGRTAPTSSCATDLPACASFFTDQYPRHRLDVLFVTLLLLLADSLR
jgi:hypothetical protein